MDTALKLLLLEDDPADAELIQFFLRRSGIRFSADIASDEKEFLKALNRNGFDAVLADNALPQYSSIEALRIIKQKNPFVAFILVTGTVSEEFAVNIIQQGADDYILKNSLTRLPSALSKAVENKKLQKEKYLAEKEMSELNEQLRDLTAHVQDVREEEQIRIAREIHDELGQMLTTIKMDIVTAGKNLERSPADVSGNLSDALKMVDNTITTIRRIASGLRPGILDDLGLIAALEWQSRDFEKHHNIKCLFAAPDADLRLSKNVSTGLYRIYQEALTNIARHSGAEKVITILTSTNDNITLTISDNGRGFDPREIKVKKTLGLIGIKERAIIMKGSLFIESATGKGTKIIVTVPASEAP